MNPQVNWHALIMPLAMIGMGVAMVFHGDQKEGTGLIMGGLAIATPGTSLTREQQKTISQVDSITAGSIEAKP